MLGRAIDQCRPIHNPAYFGKKDARPPVVYCEWAKSGGATIPNAAQPELFWGNVLPILNDAEIDATLFNLETAVTTENSWTQKTFNFRMHPAGLDVLKAANINCVNLANNHVLDFGTRGLLDTLDFLHAEGIATCGAGVNALAALAPSVQPLPEGGRLLAFGMACLDAGCRPNEQALAYRPGIQLLPELHANAEPADIKKALSRVREIIHLYSQPNDVTILSIHWGGNWPQSVTEAHRIFAHQCIDYLGINMIHGHSSHIPMEVERHGNGLILYGCGDVINDYEGKPKLQKLKADTGALFVVEADIASRELTCCHTIPIRRKGFCLEINGLPSTLVS